MDRGDAGQQLSEIGTVAAVLERACASAAGAAPPLTLALP
jgi:hypothetical protein